MGKKKNLPPARVAELFGVGKLTRHLFICLGPDCADLDDGEQTWKYLKKRMKELDIAGPDGPCYRTKCQCLRTARRRLRRHTEGRVRNVTEAKREHNQDTIGGRVARTLLARNPI